MCQNDIKYVSYTKYSNHIEILCISNKINIYIFYIHKHIRSDGMHRLIWESEYAVDNFSLESNDNGLLRGW